MISFEGIEQSVITMEDDGATVGYPCVLSDSALVVDADEDDEFIGVCIWNDENGLAGVQIGGFVTLHYSGTTAPELGYAYLCADGDGKVAVAESGVPRLVVEVNAIDKLVTFRM